MMYRTWCEHANYYNTDVVVYETNVTQKREYYSIGLLARQHGRKKIYPLYIAQL
jgi:hypothetical protein